MGKCKKIIVIILCVMIFVMGGCNENGELELSPEILTQMKEEVQDSFGELTDVPVSGNNVEMSPEPTTTPEPMVTSEPENYSFFVTIEPEGAGKMNAEKDGIYEPGTEIRVGVKPENNYIFAGWYDGNERLDIARNIKITLTKDTHLKAVFVAPTPTPSPVRIEESKAGDIVVFGTYEQDNDVSNGPEGIEWIVLKEEDGKMMLLSRYVLDTKKYHPHWYSYDDAFVWENCDLRDWMNKNFYNKAFNSEDKNRIVETVVENPDNEKYGIEGGPATRDKVFLLSIDEVKEFFPLTSSYEREGLGTVPTEYATAQGARVETLNHRARWWLRSPGHNSRWAGIVSGQELLEAGSGVRYPGIGIRPVVWLQKE